MMSAEVLGSTFVVGGVRCDRRTAGLILFKDADESNVPVGGVQVEGINTPVEPVTSVIESFTALYVTLLTLTSLPSFGSVRYRC